MTSKPLTDTITLHYDGARPAYVEVHEDRPPAAYTPILAAARSRYGVSLVLGPWARFELSYSTPVGTSYLPGWRAQVVAHWTAKGARP